MVVENQYQSFQVPDNIRRMSVSIPNDKKNLQPVIPNTIEMLQLNIGMYSKKTYTGLVSNLKNLTIPSSVKKLDIRLNENSNHPQYEDLMIKILGTDLQVKKSRKVNTNDKEKLKDYFIPPSVTKLSLPNISNDIMEYIPPTVSHLVVHDGVPDDIIIPPSIEHLELMYLFDDISDIPFATPDTLLKITCSDCSSYCISNTSYTLDSNEIRNRGKGAPLIWTKEPSVPPAFYKEFGQKFNLNNLEQSITPDTVYVEIVESCTLFHYGDSTLDKVSENML